MGPGPAPPSLTSTDTGSHIVRAGHKRYFFDLGSNNKGQYLRITEVQKPSHNEHAQNHTSVPTGHPSMPANVSFPVMTCFVASGLSCCGS